MYTPGKLVELGSFKNMVSDMRALYAEGLLTPKAMDVCWREGVFYNPDVVTPEEIETIKAFATKHDIKCTTLQGFIKKIFYRQEWINRYIPEPKLIIGHNVVFDIGALSHHTGQCRRDPKMYGGLSFALCDCRLSEIERTGEFQKCNFHPNIKIEKLNAGKHFIRCGTKCTGVDKNGNKKCDDMCLEFLDTLQFAGALLGAGCDKSLKALCRTLKTPHQKSDSGDHGRTIDDAYLGYARNDVQTLP